MPDLLHLDPGGHDHAHSGTYVASGKMLRGDGVLAETIPRYTRGDVLSPLVSGRQAFQLIYLEAGTLVSNITFVASAALAAGTNQWFSLYSLARAKLAVTADDTSTAWGAGSAKTLAVASPYTVPTSGHYYLGIMVAAGTPPTIVGASSAALAYLFTPLLCGHDATNTGLTTPATAPATAAALTATNSVLYAHVS